MTMGVGETLFSTNYKTSSKFNQTQDHASILPTMQWANMLHFAFFYGNYSLIKSNIKLLIDNIETNIQNIAFLTLKMT